MSAIKTLKSKEAPSPDGVEALKCFTDTMCGTLSVIFDNLKHLPPRMELLHYNPSPQILR